MKKTALVIMAAGIGSRFGKGIKQLEPVGPCGEIIMDYSIYDALEAGFDKVVFVIRKDLEADFREIIGSRIEKLTDVAYAYQEMDALPDGYITSPNRAKPWGTGHAVLSCKGVVREPFMVINADDYYGRKGFRAVHDFLVQDHSDASRLQLCMAGFVLGNTLSDNGSVTRGVCHVKDGKLTGVTETTNIIKTPEGPVAKREDGTCLSLHSNDLVSMNMWGLYPAFMDTLEQGFHAFLAGLDPNDAKTEYLLPAVIDQMIQEKTADVTVLRTDDSWFGVTYQEDKYAVRESFMKLIGEGVYPSPLFSPK